MKLYFFFNFSFNFLTCKICSLLFNKFEKNKTLISYFPAHFPWHNQTLENVFQLIFHYTTKYRKIIHFSKGNYFPANKRGFKDSALIIYDWFIGWRMSLLKKFLRVSERVLVTIKGSQTINYPFSAHMCHIKRKIIWKLARF